MNDELTNLTNIPAPTLTLDPVVEDTTVKASVIEVEAPPAPSLADSLSAEELAQVDAFARQIDIANSQQVLTFGSGARRRWPTSPRRPSSVCAPRIWARPAISSPGW